MNLEILNNYFDNEEYFYTTLLNHKDFEDYKNYLNNKDKVNFHFKRLQELNKKYSIYYTPNVFNKDNFGRKTYNVEYLKGFIFDFDKGDTYKNCKNLITIFPDYFYILESSKNKYQVLYKFDEVINDKELFEEYEKINLTIATYFNSDTTTYNTNHLFRFPTSINKKNEFQSVIKKNEQKTISYQEFKNFISSENLEIITPKVKCGKTPTKINNHIKNGDFVFNFDDKLKTIDDNLYFQYLAIYKRNNKNASNTDILYLKARRKKNIEFDIIFKEIMFIREEQKLILKREVEDYYSYYLYLFENSF